MNNTAEKLEYQAQMEDMLGLSKQAFARTIWDDPEKAKSLWGFWKAFAHEYSENVDRKTMAQMEMRRIEAIMLKMTDINTGFYGTKASSYINDVDSTATDIEEILPESNESESEEQGKVVPLHKVKDLGDKPLQADISQAARELLAEGKEEDALALARQYLGKGNYTPRKEKTTPKPWEENQISGWIRNLKKGPKPIETSKPPATDSESMEFGKHKTTLGAETHALKDFSERYVKLATGGSEDALAAEDLAGIFFKHRNYSAKQVQVWKETVTKNNDISRLDHFAVLGTMGTLTAELVDNDKKYEKINEAIKNAMQDIQVTKPALENKDGLLTYLITEIGRKFYDNLINTAFESSEGTVYEMYTKLHVNDFIERVVTANFTESDSQVTTNEQATQEQTGEASDSNITVEELKEQQSTGKTVKAVTVAIIRNQGVIEDAFASEQYNKFVGEGKEYETREELDRYVDENFQEWHDDYRNGLTTFPLDIFNEVVETAYLKEISVEDIIKEAKGHVIKPNGGVLVLIRPDEEGKTFEVKFNKPEDIDDYVKGIYNSLDKEKAEKEAQANDETETVEESTIEVEETTEKRVEEESSADKSSGEAIQPAVESKNTTGPTVKVKYIEDVCYKAIKGGQDMAYLMKDRKIQQLVAEGGTITGPTKDISQSYDTSSESFEKLKADLEQIYARITTKKGGKKTIVEKVKEITSISKGEEPETKETEVVDKQPDKGEESKSTNTVDTTPTSINSFAEAQIAGFQLIKGGCTKYDLMSWGKEVFLNRKMKEHANDEQKFTTQEKVEIFMKGFFKDFLKSEEPAKEETKEPGLTLEHLTQTVIDNSKEEGMTYAKLCIMVKTACKNSTLDLSTTDQLRLVRENAEELYKVFRDKQYQQNEETKNKVFVPEKVSETEPTVWDKVKGFTTIGEIYAISMELIETGEWQRALNIATELIKLGNITDAQNWDDNQISQWFGTNVLKKPTVKKAEKVEEVKVEENLDDNFRALQTADGGKSFRNALIKIMAENEDNEALRDKIMATTRDGRRNYARKMAKLPTKKLQDKINGAKAAVKSKTK